MAVSKIKEQFLTKYIAFGKSAEPLGKREDIDDLAIIALTSNNKTLLDLFESIPSLGILRKNKTESELKRIVIEKK